MLVILSPAKTLDLDTPINTKINSSPNFEDETKELVNVLREYKSSEISKLMGLSEKLSDLNFNRFQDFSFPLSSSGGRPALNTFKGDSYLGFELDAYSDEDYNYAQKHLRILSGLYGLLRPMDLIQPYRLEMGTDLKTEKGKNLYQFWDKKITESLNEAIKNSNSNFLINLASNEYFKSIKKKELDTKIIEPVFKDFKKDKFKIISFFAKRARGNMANYIIKNKIQKLEDLYSYNIDGYRFSESESTDSKIVFLRKL